MILPLANRRDRETQILWGIRDFTRRFGRDPEGMWLPETAVDLETLESLVRHGIRFVILSPWQARRVRPVGGRAWRPTTDEKIDPTQAYRQVLPSGARIAVFFYDAPISQSVAFERILDSGIKFANRLMQGFSASRDWPQLMNIATDGESYGHHHRHGDMALAHALAHIEELADVELTNYGEYLERHPPAHEVEIEEKTSWSCGHGLARWMENCGDSSGGHPGWSQEWRAPLREALDWLRDELIPLFDGAGREIFHDAWRARDEYIDVILDRSPASVESFLGRQARGALSDEVRRRALRLMEMQRHAMLMYTSCGWFFDDLSRIETVQVIRYAARALQLAESLSPRDLESPFLERLQRARSNVPENGTGRDVFERHVRPSWISLREVGAHYAVSSLFEEFPDETGIYCYDVLREAHEVRTAGRMRLAVGRAAITSRITQERSRVTYGALYMGDHNVVAGVRELRGTEDHERLLTDLTTAFETADTPAVVRLLDKHFGDSSVSLRSLFRDEQDELVKVLLKNNLEDGERVYQRLYEQNAPVMKFLARTGMTIPPAMQLAAERAINQQVLKVLSADARDAKLVGRLLQEARERNISLDHATLSYALESTLNRLAARLRANPESRETLDALHAAVDVAVLMPFRVSLWHVQNAYWELLTGLLPGMKERAAAGGEGPREWVERFGALGEKLRIRAA